MNIESSTTDDDTESISIMAIPQFSNQTHQNSDQISYGGGESSTEKESVMSKYMPKFNNLEPSTADGDSASISFISR